MRRSLPIAIASLVALACGGGADRREPEAATGPRTVVRDSAGIRIVENTSPPEGSRIDWRVGPEPLVTIGQEGEGPYLFERIFGAVRLSDGRIVVGDERPRELRVFDRHGTHLETWGGTGQGPGEFSAGQLWGLRKLPGDSIIVYEYFYPQLTVFGPDGEFLRRFMLEESGFGLEPTRRRHFWVLEVTPGGLIVGGQDDVDNDPTEVAVWDSEGKLLGSLGEHTGREVIREGGRAIEPVNLYRSAFREPWGDLILIGTNHRYELRAFALDGSLARIVRLDHTLRTPTRAHIEAMIESELSALPADDSGRRAERRRELLGRSVAEHLPAFYSYRVDGANYLWVYEYKPPGERTTPWPATIYDPEGRILGFFEPPRGALLEIGEDYILSRVRDEMGVQSVQLWPLERSP